MEEATQATHTTAVAQMAMDEADRGAGADAETTRAQSTAAAVAFVNSEPLGLQLLQEPSVPHSSRRGRRERSATSRMNATVVVIDRALVPALEATDAGTAEIVIATTTLTDRTSLNMVSLMPRLSLADTQPSQSTEEEEGSTINMRLVSPTRQPTVRSPHTRLIRNMCPTSTSNSSSNPLAAWATSLVAVASNSHRSSTAISRPQKGMGMTM